MFTTVLSKNAQNALAVLGQSNCLPKSTYLAGGSSPQDIAAMKLAAIMDRGTKKDFIDLYKLSKKGINIEKAFSYYETKYKSLSNNLYGLIKSLSYFEDAEKLEMPEMIEKISWNEVKSFFEKETVRLVDKYL